MKKYGIITLKKFDYEKEGGEKQVTERRNGMGRLSVKERFFFFKTEKISPCLNSMYAQ